MERWGGGAGLWEDGEDHGDGDGRVRVLVGGLMKGLEGRSRRSMGNMGSD